MISVIGMGPGQMQYLTLAAIEKIKQAKKVITFGRISKTAENLTEHMVSISRVKDIVMHINQHNDSDIAILASGDPCYYGIVDYLKSKNIAIDEVIPGISSFQYMMSKLKKSWHNAYLTSLHGREEDWERIIKSPLTVILTDHKHTPAVISNLLYERGMRGTMYAGFNLSYEDECIMRASIGEKIKAPSSLSVVVIENEMDKR